jgi:hypothetical protein
MWVNLLFVFVSLAVGIAIGFITRSIRYRSSAKGTIVVSTDESEKLIYSLQLNEDPENLQYEEMVTFLVKKRD